MDSISKSSNIDKNSQRLSLSPCRGVSISVSLQRGESGMCSRIAAWREIKPQRFR